jgi:hypothetical protein
MGNLTKIDEREDKRRVRTIADKVITGVKS